MLKDELEAKVQELIEESNGKFKVKYRRLGKTNLMVSEVGLGGHEWGLDGRPGTVSPNERLEVIKKALELGVNYFDVTNDYEGERLGKYLRELDARKKVIIAYGESTDKYVQKADETHIRGLLENQLKLLGTDMIDIFMVLAFPVGLYVQNASISAEEEFKKISQILEKLKKEGKIRFSCLGTQEQESFEKWTEKADIGNLFDALQINFNFLDNGPLKKIIPYAREHDMGVMVMTPFRKGTLLNKDWGGDKPRNLISPDDPLFENLKDKEMGLDWALLKYVISVEGISTVIPGVANREQLLRNLAVSIFRDE